MKLRHFDKRKRSVLVRSVAIALVTVAGCGPPRSEFFDPLETLRVWPEPPEQPRIMYLGSVSTETDLEQPRSWFQGFGELVFGKGDVGILVSPYAVTVDPTGIMFVADSGGAAVHAFDLRTRAYDQFSQLSDNERLERPVGLAMLEDHVYVVDSVLRRVCVFRKDGRFLFAFGDDRFERPSGIACQQSNGLVYVADTGSHAIYTFDREGRFVRQIGSRGLDPGQFNFPTHLWLDRAGQLYVSDTLNYRVQVLTEDGAFVRMFGQQGDRPGNFAHPCAVATDSHGNIYVTDRQYENVQIFNSAGQILMAFGQEGQGPGEFWLPAGIFVDRHDRIYVADSFNKRVQIFELLGSAQNE